MSPTRVVVDGSNIATEGRSLPSLRQLDEAVRAYKEENPDADITVVVDATFAHRIDDSERAEFEEAASHNELVYPPAGAIGRGDAFLLRIAEKTGAIVLSNDSFQEFHGEHDWLFTKGRLVGGTPVPGIGWIFVARTPVRGPKSRESVKEAKRTQVRIGSKDASAPMPVPKAPPPRTSATQAPAAGGAGKAPRARKADKKLERAIAEAVDEVVAPGEVGEGADDSGRKRRRKRKGGIVELPTVNDPLTFIQFIADNKLGAAVTGVVDGFASHGAFVMVGNARCYIPLSAMGTPSPRSAREVLSRGDEQQFVLQALDAPRRGIELALPGFERVAGQPTEETVEAEIEEATGATDAPSTPRRSTKSAGTRPAKKASGARKRSGAARPDAVAPEIVADDALVEAQVDGDAADTAPAAPKKAAGRSRKAVAKVVDAPEPTATDTAPAETPAPTKATAKKAAVAKTAAATKAPASKKATAAKKVASARAEPVEPVEPVAPKKVATRKAAAKKAASAAEEPAAPATASRKTAGTKKAAASKAAATKTAATKTAARKTAATKTAATETAPEQVATEPAPVKTASTKKAPAKKAAAAKKAPTKKAAATTTTAAARTRKAATAAKKAAAAGTLPPEAP